MYKKQQFHVGCEPISLIGRPYSKKAGYVIEVFGCEGEQDFHYEMRRTPAEKSWRLIQTDAGRQQAGSHGYTTTAAGDRRRKLSLARAQS
jgi:hypothetical protein